LRRFLKSLRKLFRDRLNKIDSNALKILLEKESISMIDLGAAGGIEPRWAKISAYLNYFGFEPDSRTIQLDPNKEFKSYTVIPSLVSNKTEKKNLYISHEEGKSSIYQPNSEFISRFPNPRRFETVKTVSFETSTIDDLIKKEIDFIKLDIQGAELDALQGSPEVLKSVLGIESEVEFIELYKSQPLFGHVNDFLLKQGFEFIDFTNLRRWERGHLGEIGQCVFGDALYLRSPEFISSGRYSEIKIRRYISILFLYNRFDLIEVVLRNNPVVASKLEKFNSLLSKKKARLNFAVKINVFTQKFLSFIGVEFKSQLIY
jgi:FkbM family methyltransferase